MGENAPNYFSIFNIEMLSFIFLLKLLANDGVTHDSPNYILKEEVKYFKNMFSFQSPPSPLIECFSPNNNVKLTVLQKDSCEGQITEDKLLDAIKLKP